MYQDYIKNKIKSPRYKYLIQIQRQIKAIKLFRIGQRINQASLREAAKEEISKLYFANCNPTYCMIFAAI